MLHVRTSGHAAGSRRASRLLLGNGGQQKQQRRCRTPVGDNEKATAGGDDSARSVCSGSRIGVGWGSARRGVETCVRASAGTATVEIARGCLCASRSHTVRACSGAEGTAKPAPDPS
jgi:hypothetical protein